MRLIDGYECEVKEESADPVGRFQGTPYTLNQAPITRKCIFDGNTGKPITKEQYKAMCRPMGVRMVGGSYPE